MMIKIILIAIGTLFIATQAHAGGIKKWIDADGNVHFGDAPPAQAASDAVEVKQMPRYQDNAQRLQAESEERERLRWQKTADTASRDKPRSAESESAGRSCIDPAERGYSERLRFRNAAIGGEVLFCMTPTEVRRAMGDPVKINPSAGSWGTKAQWVYELPTGDRRYIYLRDGRVMSWN